jgi:hypothetical protein
MKKLKQLLIQAILLTLIFIINLQANVDESLIFIKKATESGSAGENTVNNMIGVLRNRWIAGKEEHQWLQLELESPIELKSIRINWENAYAKSFNILAGMKENNMKEIYTVTDQKKINRKPIKMDQPVKVKYIRLNCRKRALKYAYSIFNITINGKMLYKKFDMVKDLSFQNKNLSPEARAKIVLKQMTFEEKRAYTTGFNNFFIPPLFRFKMRSIYMTDASGGVHIRNQYYMEKSVAYPALVALTATWEPELAHRYASAIGFGFRCTAGPWA